MLAYPVTLTPEKEGGYVVTFRDIPEAITQGETVEEALRTNRNPHARLGSEDPALPATVG